MAEPYAKKEGKHLLKDGLSYGLKEAESLFRNKKLDDKTRLTKL